MKTLEKQLFFDMLHKARELKSKGWKKIERKIFMSGMVWHYATHLPDLRIAENTKDYWINKADGAEL